MDWHLLGLSFITVFVSELGDKSQLATIALGSNARSLRAVFAGAVCALLLASFLGVVIGGGRLTCCRCGWVKAIAAS
ncbi:MAG: TMEM165/GDT1 family protein, partial [Leptolyngbyaceae cyanobacterium SL_7_1]|nr:TMEM165/GDT1 family protein [Leptolyngbyaceae cyanobacterium SL_7_1]